MFEGHPHASKLFFFLFLIASNVSLVILSEMKDFCKYLVPSQEKQLKRFGDVPDKVVIQQMQESSVKIKSSAGYYYQV